MSESLYYRTRFEDISAVERAFERAAVSFADFEGFEPGDDVMVTVHPSKLTDLEDLHDVAHRELRVTGEMALDEDPFPTFRRVLEEGWKIGRDGYLEITVGFEEKGFRQDKQQHDVLSASVVKGSPGWSFIGRGALERGDAKEYRDFLGNVVSISELPLRIVEKEGVSRLEHTQGGRLTVTQSRHPRDGDPVWFLCDLPGATAGQLVDRISRAVAELGTSTLFESSWKAMPVFRDKDAPRLSETIYEMIVGAPEAFRARRYQISGKFQLLGLAGLESLRSLCGEQDGVLTALGFTRDESGGAVNLQVETRAEGHRLVIESRGPIAVHDFEETLGVKLEISE